MTNKTIIDWQPIETAPYRERVLFANKNGLVLDAQSNWSMRITIFREPATHWAPMPELPETES